MKQALLIPVTAVLVISGCSSVEKEDALIATSSDSLDSAKCELLHGPVHTEDIMSETPGNKLVHDVVIGRGPGCEAKCSEWADAKHAAWQRGGEWEGFQVSHYSVDDTVVCETGWYNVPVQPPTNPNACRLVSPDGVPFHREGPFHPWSDDTFSSADGRIVRGYGDRDACAYACSQWRTQYHNESGLSWNRIYTEFSNYPAAAVRVDASDTGIYSCAVGHYNP